MDYKTKYLNIQPSIRAYTNFCEFLSNQKGLPQDFPFSLNPGNRVLHTTDEISGLEEMNLLIYIYWCFKTMGNLRWYNDEIPAWRSRNLGLIRCREKGFFSSP
jgi:hypothetical protein